MSGPGIPPAVRRLIADELPSVVHLEILLLMFQSPTEWWSAGRMAAQIHMPAQGVLDRMEQLCSRGLLEVRTAEDLVFRYGPARPDLEEAVALLARSYPEHRVAITDLVFSTGRDPVRDFSEAFRIRKRDPDGR
jgi:hypothetical protein